MEGFQIMKISISSNDVNFDIDFVKFTKNDFLKKVREELECDKIDVIWLDSDFSAFVDDGAYMTKGNPIFDFNNEFQLGGSILITKHIETDKGIGEGEITINDAYEFLNRYNVKVLGKTK